MAISSTLKMMIQTAHGMGWQAALRAVQYTNTVRALNRRFEPPKPSGAYQRLGAVQNAEPHMRGARLQTQHGYIDVSFLSSDVVRVRVRADADFEPPFSYAVEKVDWLVPTLEVQEHPQYVVVRSEQIVCEIEKENGRLRFTTPDGRVLSQDAEGVAWRGPEVRWSRHLPPHERCYGLGERGSGLNLRGKRLALWNADPLPAYKPDDDPLYFSIPFYLGVRPEVAVGIFWDNPARGWVDLGAQSAETQTFFAETGELRFYLFAGARAEQVLQRYTELTGRMPLPPMWALGFHQSRWGYDSEQTFRDLAAEFRRRKLPCDALYFDIDYMDGYRVFTWDRKRFPLLPRLLAELEEQGFRSVAIINPGIKVDADYEVYQDGLKQDVFLKYPHGKPAIGPVWPGKCAFPDFTSAAVRAWWAGYVRTLMQAGFAGLWNDMNEPTVITLMPRTTLPDYVVHDWDGLGRSHVGGGHNVYGMLMSRATREGMRKAAPEKRPFLLTRATYAGGQRYASSWTGDNAATWEHLRMNISMVLNLGLAGIAFTGADIGGFAGEADGELFTRWMQLGSMMPYFRAHTMAGTAPQEPWSYGERYEAIVRRYLELRYQILPYLYSAIAQSAQSGVPIVRPLFMADPSDPKLYDVQDAFLLGDSILVAPILEQGATQREVYLPRGVWYEFDTGKLTDGARTITAQAPLERMPIYVRAGRVIPMWPVMQYVGERPLAEARLRVYAGSGDTTLYEDAGEGLDYQRGDYRWSYFTCSFSTAGHFVIDWRRAGRYEPPYRQTRVEVVGISAEPEMVMLDGQAAPIWYYEGGIVEFIVQPFDEARIIGHVRNTTGPRPPQEQRR